MSEQWIKKKHHIPETIRLISPDGIVPTMKVVDGDTGEDVCPVKHVTVSITVDGGLTAIVCFMKPGPKREKFSKFYDAGTVFLGN